MGQELKHKVEMLMKHKENPTIVNLVKILSEVSFTGVTANHSDNVQHS